MTATYTANLASLLVDRRSPPIVVETIEEAAVFGYPICTLEGTNSDTYIRDTYPSAIRIEKKTIEDVYDSLNNGDCQFAAEVKASWLELKSVRKYNPTCDLEWVGGDRVVSTVTAGFATKADAGYLCSGLIRDVINLHMEQMIIDGFIDNAWDREYKRSQDIDCNVYRPELYENIDEEEGTEEDDEEENSGRYRHRRRLDLSSLSSSTSRIVPDGNSMDAISSRRPTQRRQLKAGGRGGASGGAVASFGDGSDDLSSEKLTIEQMIGTFAFHWILMGIAIVCAIGTDMYQKHYPTDSQATEATDNGGVGPDGDKSGNNSGDDGDTKVTKATSLYKGMSTVSGISDFFKDTTNGTATNGTVNGVGIAVDNNNVQATAASLQKEVTELRQSQLVMQEFQKEMLEEQKKLQRQIQSLSTSLMFQEQPPTK